MITTVVLSLFASLFLSAWQARQIQQQLTVLRAMARRREVQP